MGDQKAGYRVQGLDLSCPPKVYVEDLPSFPLLPYPPKVYVDSSGHANLEKKSAEEVADFGHGCITNAGLSGMEQSVKWIAFWQAAHCSICNTSETDHITKFCPFLALASKSDCSRQAASAQEIADSSVTDLSGVERRIADLETRLGLNLLRVNNILDHTYSHKFFQRFKRFGKVTHVYVPDGGNGFVNFADKERAKIAIEKLNGSKFEDFVLQVEWANERPK